MATKVREIGGGRTATLDPKREYVAGGSIAGFPSFTADGVRALSTYYDDLTKEHSSRIYERMMTDPEVAKCINVLKISVLGDGVELLPAVPESDERYEEALKIAKFCEEGLKSLEYPIRNTLEQMMDALVDGHKIAEVTYTLRDIAGLKGKYLIPYRIKVKARDTVAFVIDEKMNVIGLTPAAFYPYGNSESDKDLQKRVKDGEVLINGRPILPREKFLVLSINQKDGDPRGRSLLRPAFHAWHLKMQIWPEYLRYLLLCSIPLLVGFTPENDTIKELVRDADGNPLRDTDGRFVEVNPVEALKNALLQARNAEVLAVKGGTRIQEVGAQGAGTPFFKAIELFDRQMETGVLLQTLATSEGVRQSRAAAQTHMSVLDQLVWWLKGVVVDMLVSDLLRPMVRFNFGDDALNLLPKPTLGDTERRDFSTDASAISLLYRAGYLQPEQLKQTDAMLGLAIRQTTDPLQLIQQLQAAGVPIIATPPPPEAVAQVQAGPGGGNTPVPAAGSGAVLPVSQATSPLPTGESATRGNTSPNVRFPAVGRVKSKINRTPQNFADELEETDNE